MVDNHYRTNRRASEWQQDVWRHAANARAPHPQACRISRIHYLSREDRVGPNNLRGYVRGVTRVHAAPFRNDKTS
jgi:hypothetical protein